MDYHKINSHIILLLVVIVVGLGVATLGREIALEAGRNVGTANLIFLIILIVCSIAYLIIMATLAHIIIPYIMEKLPSKKKSAPIITENSVSETPKQSTEDIRHNYAKTYIEKQNTKINLFLEYSHLTFAPYITDNELSRLDEYIKYYVAGESLPENLIPLNPMKLKQYDLFHFGWNMANYFDYKKEEVPSWLQTVFFELQKFEFSYIYKKLRIDAKRCKIPIIEDIPKYLAEIKD
ncbi:MAG: magnesium transporter [Dysgonamonadaceae bacterium]|jgi:hypothetical protein|nr:magnesium transporter [Dysgonamonadaceae bacterium]